MQITPVILCGGSGTRLWPLSRQSFPKQFARITGETSLFQRSALRTASETASVRFTPPMIVTGSDFRFIAVDQLIEVGMEAGTVLIEPEARNTAPAILAAALHAFEQDPEAVLLVMPSDHEIPDDAAFLNAVAQGADAVQAGKLVTFGITPDRAETGYGYLQLSAPINGEDQAVDLLRFVEKPDEETAERLIEQGDHLWNAGIFLFAARDIIAAYKNYASDLVQPVTEALAQGAPDLNFFRLAEAPWADVEDISVDYAVMERADNIAVVPFRSGWSDLGSWEAIHRESERNETGVATHGHALAIDCKNSLLRSESDQLELVGLGLENIVAIATPDAVLVADMNRTQDVKEVVNALKIKGAKQATEFAMDRRPWGHFETLALGDRFHVKRIVVKPGAALSLQSHVHRAEHWIVVSGTAKVTIDETVQLVTENQSVYVPLGSVHRMENPGKVPMVLVEVQTGAYLGEDDIIRYEDVYARGQGTKG